MFGTEQILNGFPLRNTLIILNRIIAFCTALAHSFTDMLKTLEQKPEH
jgi:hypothetical protein